MNEFTKALAAALTLGVSATSAFAQDATAPATATPAPAAEAPAAAATDTPAPAAPLDAAPQAPAPDAAGTSYMSQSYGDWQMQCIRTKAGEKSDTDPCQMYQLLKDEKGNPVADITMIALPPGGKAVAGATVMAPLETLLTQNVVLKVDNNDPKMYPFTFCAPVGCVARVGLTAEELATFKKGSAVAVTVVPMARPNQPVTVNISLKGFTNAFDAATKNAAAVAAAHPAPATAPSVGTPAPKK